MDDRIREFAEQYRAGKTLAEIGKAHGITRERVRQLLARVGIRRRDGGAVKRAQAKQEEAETLLNAGYTAAEVEERLGYTVSATPRVSVEERREARFWLRVDKSGGPDACWPWTRGVGANGYGHTRFGNTHRRAYAYHYKPEVMPPVVRHTCDNPPCCNPAHLIGGTQAENARDREERSDVSRRVKWPREASVARDKAILSLVDDGLTQVEIGKRLGMAQPRVNEIVRRLQAGRRRWQKAGTQETH